MAYICIGIYPLATSAYPSDPVAGAATTESLPPEKKIPLDNFYLGIILCAEVQEDKTVFGGDSCTRESCGEGYFQAPEHEYGVLVLYLYSHNPL